jgi:hypothetical protein
MDYNSLHFRQIFASNPSWHPTSFTGVFPPFGLPLCRRIPWHRFLTNSVEQQNPMAPNWGSPRRPSPQNLHHWIDFVWGCNDNSLPHPHRVCHSWVRSIRSPYRLPSSLSFYYLRIYRLERTFSIRSWIHRNWGKYCQYYECRESERGCPSSIECWYYWRCNDTSESHFNSEFFGIWNTTAVHFLRKSGCCDRLSSVALIEVTTGSRTDLHF